MVLLLRIFFKLLTTGGVPKSDAAYENLPLIGAPLPVLLIDASYLAFVFSIGPKLMKNRKPFNLTLVMSVYNLAQICINFWFAFTIIPKLLESNDLDIGCLTKLPLDHKYKLLEVKLCYFYYLNKYLDYMDTVFFVLRKSYKQISFLHVYHHILMTTIGYIFLRVHGFGGHGVMIGIVNSVIHGFMYVYYLLSTWQPKLKKSYWKKMITIMQLMQFIFILIHQSWPLLFRPNCTYPKIWLTFTIIQAIIMIFLFGNFYKNAYWRSNKNNKRTNNTNSTNSTNRTNQIQPNCKLDNLANGKPRQRSNVNSDIQNNYYS